MQQDPTQQHIIRQEIARIDAQFQSELEKIMSGNTLITSASSVGYSYLFGTPPQGASRADRRWELF